MALETFETLPDRELKSLLTRAYEVVRDKLPTKTIAALAAKPVTAKKSPRRLG